jgi:predicted SAM-dependent methyltransferase
VEGDVLRLNLGCGNRHLDGYVNIDKLDNWHTIKPDVDHDITKPLPFDGVEEILAIHVFEHFHRYEADAILGDWVRALKPGGLLVLELPCLDKIIGIFNAAISRKAPIPVNLTLWGLYGDPKYKSPAMVHKWCYSIAELSGMMEDNGLTVEVMEATTHQPVRDIRLQGRKSL